MKSIKAVTFDVGGTLLEPYPSVGHVYAAVAAQHGCPGLDPDRLNQGFRAAWREKERFDYSFPAWRQIVDSTFHGLIPPGRVPFQALYQRFTEPDAWRVFDDVPPALIELQKRGLRLGIISNWDERLRPLLDVIPAPLLNRSNASSRLSDFFAGRIVVSHDVGHTKPSVEIFRRATELLEVEPEGILHVGDSLREDVMGARAAGMRAVLLDKKGVEPDAITDLRQLPDLLETG